jgi:hypothetical protein
VKGWHPVEDLGWILWAYEDQIRITPETDRAWRQQPVALTGEEPAEDELTGTLLTEDGA